MFITLDFSKLGLSIAPSGQALRDALANACGASMHGYVERKQKQLLQLGFDAGRYRTQMTIIAGSERELIDTFLGIEKDVIVKDVKTFEDRFGILLPVQPASPFGGKITLQPTPGDICTITYRRYRTARPSVFDASVVFAPRFITRNRGVVVLISNEFFQIRYQELQLEFRSAEDILSAHISTIKNWKSYFDLCQGLAVGIGEIEIRPNKVPKPIKIPLSGNKVAGMEREFYAYFAEITYLLEEIAEKAGCNEVEVVPFSEIIKNHDAIRLIHSMLSKEITKHGALKFSTEKSEAAEKIEGSATVAYVTMLTIGTLRIGSAVKAEMQISHGDDGIEWNSTKLSQFDIRCLDTTADALKSYTDEIQKEMNASAIITRATS